MSAYTYASSLIHLTIVLQTTKTHQAQYLQKSHSTLMSEADSAVSRVLVDAKKSASASRARASHVTARLKELRLSTAKAYKKDERDAKACSDASEQLKVGIET